MGKSPILGISLGLEQAEAHLSKLFDLWDLLRGPIFQDELELREIEGLAFCGRRSNQPFALALLQKLEGSMVAIRVISRLPEENMGGPRAARSARVGVVASPAKAPQIFDRAIARKAECGSLLPDLL